MVHLRSLLHPPFNLSQSTYYISVLSGLTDLFTLNINILHYADFSFFLHPFYERQNKWRLNAPILSEPKANRALGFLNQDSVKHSSLLKFTLKPS